METESVVDVVRCHIRERLPADTPKPMADFMSCVIPAVIAALPYFLESLIKCLQGGTEPPPGEHNPGTRIRC